MPDHQAPITVVKLGKALYFDSSSKRLYSKQKNIELNRAEREVLFCLVSHSPRMVSKAELLKAGWARKEVAPTSLFQTIRNLRLKLKEEEKGQIIELVPKLGYKLHATPCSALPYQETSDKKAESKDNPAAIWTAKTRTKAIYAVLLATILLIAYGIFFYDQQEQFYHQIINDDDNNTIVFLTQNTNDLTFLQNHSNRYITPKAINNKLFFIAKTKDNYSIAFCEKTEQNYCDPATARAVTFKLFELSSFWPLLTEESLSIGTMSVYKDETNIKASARSYNFYLENGRISPNLSQYFVHELKPHIWTFTGISYRMNKAKTEFIAISFKGGSFTLKKTDIEPFIATMNTKPKYFYWLNNEEELTQMGSKQPGEFERYVDSLYSQAISYDSYLLYRQQELYLWFSNELGFYWLSRQGLETSYFPELLHFEKCKDYLHLNKNPDCDR